MDLKEKIVLVKEVMSKVAKVVSIIEGMDKEIKTLDKTKESIDLEIVKSKEKKSAVLNDIESQRVSQKKWLDEESDRLNKKKQEAFVSIRESELREKETSQLKIDAESELNRLRSEIKKAEETKKVYEEKLAKYNEFLTNNK
jgi:chromosome segregation ATPase